MMTLEEYLKVQFPKDLKNLEFKRPNKVMLSNTESFRIDKNTIYFGGRDWENIVSDTKRIKQDNLDYFFLCLFTITFIDLTIFTYHNEYYKLFRSKTMYPKFGWSGFGPHYENPKKLLQIPEQKDLINKSRILNIIEEYIDLLISESKSFIVEHIPSIETKEFFKMVINDKDFQIDNNDKDSIFEKIFIHLNDYVINN